MCNLYSMRGKPKDWAAHYGVTKYDPFLEYEYTSFFPDFSAPVIRRSDGEREIAMMRWGFPKSANMQGSPVPVTNVRNTASGHWREWLKAENRCLVPVTSFAEYAPEPDPVTNKKDIVWFALNDNRPPFAFAGIWRSWTGTRGTKKNPVEGDHLLYSILTVAANEVVKPIHPQAMPVILADEEAWDVWLDGSMEEALALQRPAAAGAIKIVARGTSKED
jgi:putative SOS response-associated peptidase YedK